jgi:hypothetical protein
MNTMLRDALALFAPSSSAIDLAQPAVAAPPLVETAAIARQRLKEAIAGASDAEQAYQASRVATARVLQLIRAVEPAEAEAKQAAADAAAATRAWCEQGASPDRPSGDETLLARAADAERRAAVARLKGKGAEAALTQVRAAEEQARFGLDTALGHVKAARTATFIAVQAEPLISELQQMRPRYEALLRTLAALSLLLDPKWANGHRFRAHVDGDGEFKERVAALAIALPTERELYGSAQEWADTAAQLASDST